MNPLKYDFRDGYIYTDGTTMFNVNKYNVCMEEEQEKEIKTHDNYNNQENIKFDKLQKNSLCKSHCMVDDIEKDEIKKGKRSLQSYTIQLFHPTSEKYEILDRELKYTRELNKSLLIHLYILCNAIIDVKHLLYWMSDQSEPTNIICLKGEYEVKDVIIEQKDSLVCRRGINKAVENINKEKNLNIQLFRNDKIFEGTVETIQMSLYACESQFPTFYFLGLLASWGTNGLGKKLTQTFIQQQKRPILLEPLEHLVTYYGKMGFKTLIIKTDKKFLNGKKEPDLPFQENAHSFLDLDFFPTAFLMYQVCTKEHWTQMIQKDRLMILL